jgi:hypothetical protein
MATRVEPLKDGERTAPARSGIQWNKVFAAGAWLLGVSTTYLFMAYVLPDLYWIPNLGIAAGLQGLMTWGERPLWRAMLGRSGGRFAPMALIITLVDGVINAGGVYPYAGRFAHTSVGLMFAEVLHVKPEMTPIASLVLAMVLGLILAMLAEYLWEVR